LSAGRTVYTWAAMKVLRLGQIKGRNMADVMVVRKVVLLVVKWEASLDSLWVVMWV
jgi:hypothetical protein